MKKLLTSSIVIILVIAGIIFLDPLQWNTAIYETMEGHMREIKKITQREWVIGGVFFIAFIAGSVLLVTYLGACDMAEEHDKKIIRGISEMMNKRKEKSS